MAERTKTQGLNLITGLKGWDFVAGKPDEISQLAGVFVSERKRVTVGRAEDHQMSSEFKRDKLEEDVLHNDEEEGEDVFLQQAFEDQPMPILTTSIRIKAQCKTGVNAIFDSGSDVSLISDSLARHLPGVEIREKDRGWSITTANGTRSRLKRYLTMSPCRNSVDTGNRCVHTVPEDVVLGNDALDAWNANLDWGKSTVKSRGAGTGD